MTHINRALKREVLQGLKDFPAVFINGPRQAGKSTLARHISEKDWPAIYITFDDGLIRAAAENDPLGFARKFLDKPVVIDEVQRVPQLFLELKHIIDELRHQKPDNANGRFLLTGSSNIMSYLKLADALVGRMRVLNLYPLSAAEAQDAPGEFAASLFDKKFFYEEGVFRKTDPAQLIADSTFPVLYGKGESYAATWLADYAGTIVQRDIRELADIEKARKIPDLMNIMAAHCTGLLNEASLARDIRLNTMTFRRYRSLLESVFVITLLPAWHSNKGLRMTKAPKIFFNDTLLMAYLRATNVKHEAAANSKSWGQVLENFVFTELLKQIANNSRVKLHHFRTQDGKEVDFVLERADGDIVGIEVKSRHTIDGGSFAGLNFLKETCGKKFRAGAVLYAGDKIVPFGENLYAMPLESLWRMRVEPQLTLE